MSASPGMNRFGTWAEAAIRASAVSYAALQELQGGRVPQPVRREPLGGEGGNCWRTMADVPRYQPLDGIGAYVPRELANQVCPAPAGANVARRRGSERRRHAGKSSGASVPYRSTGRERPCQAPRPSDRGQSARMRGARFGLRRGGARGRPARSKCRCPGLRGVPRPTARRGIRRSRVRTACSGSRGLTGKGAYARGHERDVAGRPFPAANLYAITFATGLLGNEDGRVAQSTGRSR